jgi:predicted phosphodiesterase
MAMYLRPLSDLHIEFQDWRPNDAGEDAVVLAGDIHNGTQGLTWARASFPRQHIVYVAGNHEFYGEQLPTLSRQLRTAARELDIHYLDTSATVIDGVRFLGCALWSAFDFDGGDAPAIERAMRRAQSVMPDYQIIRADAGRKLTPHDTRDLHRLQVAWLMQQLQQPFDGATVVVTHHLPHARSVHPKYDSSPLNPAFVTHLPALVRSPVDVWIHGHTHESCDYRVNGTRVICNPRGYLPEEPNPNFAPDLLVSTG